jgi:hypothetical protein
VPLPGRTIFAGGRDLLAGLANGLYVAHMDGDGLAQLETQLEELQTLLKTPHVGSALGQRGVNSSLALVAVQATAAYLAGEKRRAAEDFAMVAEEVRSRLELVQNEGEDT